MDKYVHIEDLKDYLNRQIQAFEPCPDKYDAAVSIYDGLHRLPAADVTPVVHGYWIEGEKKYRHNWGSITVHQCNCSQCGYAQESSIWGGGISDSIKKTKYCPNCGARMDGE